MAKGSLFVAIFLAVTPGYSQVVNLDTLFAEATIHHDKGMRLSSAGNGAKALEEFKIATEKFRDFQDILPSKKDSVTRIFERLQSEKPRSPVYMYLFGRMVQRADSDSLHRARSNGQLNKAVEIEPNYPWPYLALAYPYFDAKDYPRAIQYYNRALAADSTFEYGYTQLIDSYHFLGMSGDSARIQNLLLLKYPRCISAIFIRMQAIRREEVLERKIKLCRELLSLANGNASARDAWTEMLFAFKYSNADSMRSLAREVLTLPGQDFAKQRQEAMMMLFSDAVKQGVAAEPIAEEALRMTDPHLLCKIGRYYLDTLKKPEIALKYLTRASEYCTVKYSFNTLVVGMLTQEHLAEITNDYLAWIHYYIGRAYVRLGKNEAAKDFLSRAALAGMKKKIVDANFQLGSLLISLGEGEHAVEWLSRGLALEANDTARAQLVSLVGSEEAAHRLIEKIRKSNERAAADFSLYSIDGDSVRSSSLKGMVVVIDFWATWCYPCVLQMPHLQKLVEQYHKNPNVAFISISMDRSRDTVKPFIAANKYTMKVLYDEGVSLEYGVESIPALFVLDRGGKIQFTHNGFNGNGKAFVKMIHGEIEELLAGTGASK